MPPQAYFLVSAVFHYLGPAFAVLLFERVQPLGVAWLRIASAAILLGAWRRPWRAVERADRQTLIAWGAVLALMNCSFYLAIDRLPLGTVAAIEFLPVIALAALGSRTPRNAGALAFAVGGVALLSQVELQGEPVGPALGDPVAIAAGIGVGICSSVIPYVADQLAMAKLTRAGYALMVALLPATATVIGLLVLQQTPSAAELTGVSLVVAAVALRREPPVAFEAPLRQPIGEPADA